MPIGEICVRDVVVAGPNTSVREAAQLMATHHVGNLVVVREESRGRIPIGIITDRDIVRNVVAEELNMSAFTLGDMVARDLVTVRDDEGVLECIQHMRLNAVRRVPVVDRDGVLVGIVSLDDLIQLLAEEMSELAKLISREQAREVEITR